MPLLSTTLRVVSTLFGTIFIAFGINAMPRPESGLSFFEFDFPVSATDRNLVEALMVVYGVRDIFMGLAIYATAYLGNRRALGWIVIAGSAVAGVDGWVCKMYAGRGEWNHWGYAPMLMNIGGLLVIG